MAPSPSGRGHGGGRRPGEEGSDSDWRTPSVLERRGLWTSPALRDRTRTFRPPSGLTPSSLRREVPFLDYRHWTHPTSILIPPSPNSTTNPVCPRNLTLTSAVDHRRPFSTFGLWVVRGRFEPRPPHIPVGPSTVPAVQDPSTLLRRTVSGVSLSKRNKWTNSGLYHPESSTRPRVLFMFESEILLSPCIYKCGRGLWWFFWVKDLQSFRSSLRGHLGRSWLGTLRVREGGLREPR